MQSAYSAWRGLRHRRSGGMPKEAGQKANWLELESSEGHLTAPVGGRVEEGHIAHLLQYPLCMSDLYVTQLR